ncbi:MAG: UDP-glucose 4-epimerase GalE [Chloroflexota bacterium]|nr:MAG: UDP-glucose 4-epimerase GalE [Chloroflexota bacterium]
MNILVTGGAGYIGSVVVEQLVNEGNQVVVVDNLSQGHREAIASEAKFYHADLNNLDKLADIFRNYDIEAVIHLAASSLVGQSMTEPAGYFQNNLVCGMNLLHAMLEYGVSKFVFSSSAAVYGLPDEVPIMEDHSTLAINPYGDSKMMFERILHWYGVAYGLKFASLRYFNAAGATVKYGEDHEPETHLIPNVLRAALQSVPQITVFGADYPTDDGTCVRDYIHVLDVARAHVLALRQLESEKLNKSYNLGAGRGYSVKEVIDVAEATAGTRIKRVISSRRPGDPPVLIADSSLAGKEIGWRPQDSELEAIIDSAWRWQKAHPRGYEGKATRSG